MRILSLFVLLLLLSAYLYADDSTRFIEVNGTSKIKEKADQISFSLRIKSIESSIEKSKIENDRNLNLLIDILKDFGDEKNIMVFPIHQGIDYKYIDGTKVKNGYFTTVNISFILKDLAKYSDLVTRLSKNDNFQIYHSAYENSKYESQNKEALKEALIAAKNKAEYLSQTLNLELGSVLEIQEVTGNNRYTTPTNVMRDVRTAEVPMNGIVTVRRSIRVKFELK